MDPNDPRNPWPFLEGSEEFAAAMRQAETEPFKPFVHRVPRPSGIFVSRFSHEFAIRPRTYLKFMAASFVTDLLLGAAVARVVGL